MLRGLRERGFDTMESETPVIPIRVGDPARTLELTAHLRARGIFVCPAIPPMVRASSSRVRLHVTAGHDDTTLARALDVICEVGSDLGLRKRPRGHALAAAAGAADGLTLGEMTE
jgi:glycine C-acetyltransferase